MRIRTPSTAQAGQMSTFLDDIEARRSYYALSKEIDVKEDVVKDIISRAVKHTPTPFNSQTGRVVFVLGEKHAQLWDAIFEKYKETLDGDASRIERNRERFNSSFKAGYGTIVFFDDDAVVEEFANRTPSLKEAFRVWASNSAGILQHVVWTALRTEGLGANLQHYGQVSQEIETVIQTALGAPKTWRSTALLPFGKPTGPPGGWQEKTYQPIEERFKILR